MIVQMEKDQRERASSVFRVWTRDHHGWWLDRIDGRKRRMKNRICQASTASGKKPWKNSGRVMGCASILTAVHDSRKSGGTRTTMPYIPATVSAVLEPLCCASLLSPVIPAGKRQERFSRFRGELVDAESAPCGYRVKRRLAQVRPRKRWRFAPFDFPALPGWARLFRAYGAG